MTTNVPFLRDKVKQAIDQSGLTVYQFSNRVGISPTHMSRLLNGTLTTRVDTVHRIADYLGVPFTEMVDWDAALAGLSGIGAEIRKHRLTRGLSLEELANDLDVSPTHLRATEFGVYNPGREIRRKIADGLGIDTTDPMDNAVFDYAKADALRAAAGLTYAELSRRSGVAQSYISKLFRGLHNPRFQTITMIANVLNTDPNTLLCEVQHA